MTRRTSARAFSLIEVIIAVALFVGTVTVILALLPGLARQTTDIADRLTAQRLPDAVRVELTRVAAGGFDSLAVQIPVMGETSANGFVLVAPRAGAYVQPLDYLAPALGRIPASERYFVIECWRFSDGPLRYENGRPVLALYVEVWWPYRERDSPSERSSASCRFVVSLNP